jgi:hypothetical protein
MADAVEEDVNNNDNEEEEPFSMTKSSTLTDEELISNGNRVSHKPYIVGFYSVVGGYHGEK